MKIKLNLDNDNTTNLKACAQKKIDTCTSETLDEAFERILSAKSISNLDRKRILSVKKALLNGDITRESKAVEKGRKITKAEVMRLHTVVELQHRQRILDEMKRNMPKNYVLVQTEDALNSAVEDLLSSNIIVFDVETTGTDIWSDEIVGHVLSSVKSDTHYYIPTKHQTDEKQLNHDVVRDALKRVYESESLKIAHNLKFDYHMLLNENIEVKGEIWDTMEAMRLLNENEDSFALKNLATKYLKIPSLTYQQLFGQRGFQEVSDLLIATAYASKDGDITYKLYEFQKRVLSEKFPSIYKYAIDVEMPLLRVVLEMERNGFVIDLEYAKQYEKELQADIDETEKRIKLLLGDINLNSPAQLKPAIEAHIGRKLANTDAKKTLKPLSKDYVVIKDILHYKEQTKLLGTYVSKLPQLISKKTGRLMATYNQNGAKTGRFSSSGGVNLQNQSPEARQLFVAPEGKVIIGADFKAQEIRCVAYLSQEPVLIEAFAKGLDSYAMMASNFYKKPYEEVYKNHDGSDTKERKQMKVVWLATLYGMSSISLAEMLGTDKKSAEKLQNDLFESMPKLQRWLDNTKKFATKTGYVWLDKKQRKRRIPEAKLQKYDIPFGKYFDDEYKEEREHNARVNRALRQAPNAVVQGSSAIQTKVTMIKLHEECKKREGWKLWCTVHDEILVELPESFSREDAKIIENIMVEGYPWGINVKNGTDLEVMKRWSDGVTIDDWFKKKGA